MATEGASNINGIYDSQYSQPAELAASTPSHAPSVSQTLTPVTPQHRQQQQSQQQQKADPQEIGWYFVEQYYTTLSKTPERIHLFYSKKSQLVTGVEAEKVLPAVGTKAIIEKIRELDIQDCKVRILNVDSQSSFENIVVQVIGEMSNKSQPHHKFVQTFVLATQPNGYFVLNDIFRYLNDEEDEIIEDQNIEEPVVAAQEPAGTTEISSTEDVVNTEEAANVVDAKLENIDQSTVGETNGLEPADTDSNIPEIIDLPAQEVDLTQASEQPPAPESTPAVEVPPKINSEQSSAAPTAKKTWANIIGNKAPAVPALPTTTPTAPQQKSVPKTTSQAPATAAKLAEAAEPAATQPASQADEWQTADHGKKNKAPQAKAPEGIVYAYLKNINEKVDARELKATLEKYGELKYFDVSRPRNCAFVEFADPTGYAAAVAANPHHVNGEVINVEERRPRPAAFNVNNNNVGRGGVNAGRGRGNFQGRGGNQANIAREKSGTFQQRGGKSGNVTPKGRGQAPAAAS